MAKVGKKRAENYKERAKRERSNEKALAELKRSEIKSDIKELNKLNMELQKANKGKRKMSETEFDRKTERMYKLRAKYKEIWDPKMHG